MQNSSAQSRPVRKILWAVDALSNDLILERHTTSVLRSINAELKAQVEPVCILRMMHLHPAGWRPALAEDIHAEAEDRLIAFLERNLIDGLLPMRALRARDTSLRGAVDTLVEYARSSGADMIVTSTHARKGVPRFFLGSFAETLLLYSPIPVLVVNPKAIVSQTVDRILFPTDFSDQSRSFYEQTLRLARALSARMVLVHQLDFPYAPVTSPMVSPPLVEESLQELERQQAHTGQSWAEWGNSQGVEVRFELLQAGKDLASELTALAGKSPLTIVAMASQSGVLASALLGSVTRQVIREVACPVLVMHPPAGARGGEESDPRQARA